MISGVRLAAVVAMVALCVTALPASADSDGAPLLPAFPAGAAVPGRYIVLLKHGKTTEVPGVLKRFSVRQEKLFPTLGGFSAMLSATQVDKLKADPIVELVEPDYLVSAYALRQPAQVLPTGIDRIDAEKNTIAQIDGSDQRVNVDIAVIDTGVQKDHPDLNVYKQVNFSSDFSLNDLNGHGTHVAGTAAALDNGIGVVGVAPGARIWAVKVLNSRGSGTMQDIIEGVDYVTANASQIEVANMSLGCTCQSAALSAALSRSIAAGVVYTVAAGNSNIDATNFSPASHPDVITVSAVADYNGQSGGGAPSTSYSGKDDTLASFSNYGSPVDIAAPGVCIKSTWKSSGYSTISGTSMASPHVAGAVALYLSHNPKPQNLTDVTAVKQAIVTAATPQTSPGGFTGDRDSFAEPLLNASNL